MSRLLGILREYVDEARPPKAGGDYHEAPDDVVKTPDPEEEEEEAADTLDPEERELVDRYDHKIKMAIDRVKAQGETDIKVNTFWRAVSQQLLDLTNGNCFVELGTLRQLYSNYAAHGEEDDLGDEDLGEFKPRARYDFTDAELEKLGESVLAEWIPDPAWVSRDDSKREKAEAFIEDELDLNKAQVLELLDGRSSVELQKLSPKEWVRLVKHIWGETGGEVFTQGLSDEDNAEVLKWWAIKAAREKETARRDGLDEDYSSYARSQRQFSAAQRRYDEMLPDDDDYPDEDQPKYEYHRSQVANARRHAAAALRQARAAAEKSGVPLKYPADSIYHYKDSDRYNDHYELSVTSPKGTYSLGWDEFSQFIEPDCYDWDKFNADYPDSGEGTENDPWDALSDSVKNGTEAGQDSGTFEWNGEEWSWSIDDDE